MKETSDGGIGKFLWPVVVTLIVLIVLPVLIQVSISTNLASWLARGPQFGYSAFADPSGDLVPASDNLYDVSDNATPLRWRNLWLSGNADVVGTLSVDGTSTLGGAVDIGNTDTTLARASAGVVSVEDVVLVGITLTQTLTNKTLTSPAINGTITTTGLTMPAFAAGGAISSSGGITFTPTTDTFFSNNTGVVVGHTAQLTVGGDLRELQVIGIGADDASILVSMHRTADATGPALVFNRGRHTTPGNFTIVAADDQLGQIRAYGADGTDYATMGGFIRFEVDGTPGANDMPTRMTFGVTADGSASPSEAMRIGNDRRVTVHTTLQVTGTLNLPAGALIDAPTTGPHVIGTSVDDRAILTLGGDFTGSSDTDGLLVVPRIISLVNNNGYALHVNPSMDRAASGTHTIFASIKASAFTSALGSAALTRAATIYITAASAVGVATDSFAILSNSGPVSTGILTSQNVTGNVGLFSGGIAFTDVANAWIDDATHGTGTVTHYIGNQTIDTTASSRTWKENISPVNDSAKAHLLTLSSLLRAYDYKNGDGHFVGMIAEDVRGLLPQYVVGTDTPSLKYHYMVGPLLWGWQDHENRLATIEQKDWLKAQLRANKDDAELKQLLTEILQGAP